MYYKTWSKYFEFLSIMHSQFLDLKVTSLTMSCAPQSGGGGGRRLQGGYTANVWWDYSWICDALPSSVKSFPKNKIHGMYMFYCQQFDSFIIVLMELSTVIFVYSLYKVLGINGVVIWPVSWTPLVIKSKSSAL